MTHHYYPVHKSEWNMILMRSFNVDTAILGCNIQWRYDLHQYGNVNNIQIGKTAGNPLAMINHHDSAPKSNNGL